jgi:hypothetical protein
MMFCLHLRIIPPKETMLGGKTKLGASLSIPLVHLLLGAATDNKDGVSLIQRDIVEDMKQVRVRFLVAPTPFHRKYAILVYNYQPIDRFHVVLLFVIKPQFTEALTGLDESLIQAHTQDHVLRLMLSIVHGLSSATSTNC